MDPKKHQQRPQYNYQYPHPQGARPNYPRQQQPASCPTLMYQPTMPGPPRFYPYMGPHYVGYNNPQSHTPPYYYAPNRPLPNMACANTIQNSSNTSAIVGQHIPTTTVPQTAQMHQPGPGMHQATTKRSHRLAIIDPVTQQDIFSELSNEKSSGTEDKKPSQTDQAQARSIAEEFSRIVYEAAHSDDQPKINQKNIVPSTNQPDNEIKNFNSEKTDLINSNIPKSENVKPLQSEEMCTNQTENEINYNPVEKTDLIVNKNCDKVPEVSVNAKPMDNSEIRTNKHENPISHSNNEITDLIVNNNAIIVPKTNIKTLPSDTNQVKKEQINNNSVLNKTSEKNSENLERKSVLKKGDLKMDAACPIASISVGSLAIPIVIFPVSLPQPAVSVHQQSISMPQQSVSLPKQTVSRPQTTVLKPQSAVFQTATVKSDETVKPKQAVMPQPTSLMSQTAVSMPQQDNSTVPISVMSETTSFIPQVGVSIPKPGDLMPTPTDLMSKSTGVSQTDVIQTETAIPKPIATKNYVGSRKSEEKYVKEDKESRPLTDTQYSSVSVVADTTNKNTDAQTKTEDKVFVNTNYKTLKKKNRRKAAKLAASNANKEQTGQTGRDEADKALDNVEPVKNKVEFDKEKTDIDAMNESCKNVNKEALNVKLESGQTDFKTDKVEDCQNKVKNDQNINKKVGKEPNIGESAKDETDKLRDKNKANNKSKKTKESEGNKIDEIDKILEDLNRNKESKKKGKTTAMVSSQSKDDIKVTDINKNKELDSQNRDSKNATLDRKGKRNKKSKTAVSKDTEESNQNLKSETDLKDKVLNKVAPENINNNELDSLNEKDNNTKIIMNEELEAKSIKKEEHDKNQKSLKNTKNSAELPTKSFDVTNIVFKQNIKYESDNNKELINKEIDENLNKDAEITTENKNQNALIDNINKSLNAESESNQTKDENIKKAIEIQENIDFRQALSLTNLKDKININITAKLPENVSLEGSQMPSKDEAIIEKRDSINIDSEMDENYDKIVEESVDKIDEKSVDVTKSVLKYKYNDDQWCPLNRNGKKYYSIGLLRQIKEDPLSKGKPNAPLLESCFVLRTTPMPETQPFAPLLRPMEDTFMPQFAKSSPGSWNVRDMKRDGRNMGLGKSSMKLPPSSYKPVIHVSLSLRNEVKLNETESAWKPTRLIKDELPEEELKTQELYKTFRGILNKLTPQKFDTLLEKVKALNIDNQKRLQGVIDLIFQKAIDEPNFSEAYAAMCSKMSMIKVPSESNPDQYVTFRALIITKCQHQFQTNTTDEQVLKLEKEYEACTDPSKKKELQLMLQEENRRVRMRSVGNVRFIGELYKLKMLTLKIMLYCTNYLIENHEEDKLECLCKLLTTIGQQIESEGASQLDSIFKKMLDITKTKISSRVKFMILDVIELRKRRWMKKNVVDLQPKTMDQIQKEAEMQQRNIEIMNAGPIGGSRRDDGRGKRDNRRQNFDNNNWKPTKTTHFPVDTSKLKAVGQKNLSAIKLAPHQSPWNHGSGAKTLPPVDKSSNSLINLSRNMYSTLDNAPAEASMERGNLMNQAYTSAPKGASIERSTFSSRDFNIPQSSSGTRSQYRPKPNEAPEPLPLQKLAEEKDSKRSHSALEVRPGLQESAIVPQEPLTTKMENSVKCAIDQFIMSNDIKELCADVTQMYSPRFHAAVVALVVDIAANKNAKEAAIISEALLHLVATNTISTDHFLAGLKDTLEFAPDIYIDVPMLYNYLGMIVAPHIEKKYITFSQILNLSKNIISENQGDLLLKAIISNMYENMGATFVQKKWLESGMELSHWMNKNQVSKWIEDNKFQFLEGPSVTEETKGKLTPEDARSKLLKLMKDDEDCKCIKSWIQDKLGPTANQTWFTRELIQAIVQNAYTSDKRLNQDRMNKYIGLVEEFGEKTERELACLVGVQRLVHRLEHPQGLTLEIFQYLHENYIISLEGFLSWEKSDKDPEGKGVMLVALTSFFNNIKEENEEDSCSED